MIQHEHRQQVAGEPASPNVLLAEHPVPEASTDNMAHTLVLRVGYRGDAFSGFARQKDQRTVQGELEAALSTLFRRPVELVCAGRTDAGVHAIGQYVSTPITRAEREISRRRLLSALGALSPDDISVQAAYEAPLGFSARFDAVARSYRYRIWDGPGHPVMSWGKAWQLRYELDVDAMNTAAQSLIGEHDFASFCKKASAIGKPTHRCVEELQVHRIQEAGEELVAIDIRANAFLHSMVRTIAGTLVEVGAKRRDVGWPAEVLASCDRQAAGPCAAACGLTFVDVHYPAGLLQAWEDLK